MRTIAQIRPWMLIIVLTENITFNNNNTKKHDQENKRRNVTHLVALA